MQSSKQSNSVLCTRSCKPYSDLGNIKTKVGYWFVKKSNLKKRKKKTLYW